MHYGPLVRKVLQPAWDALYDWMRQEIRWIRVSIRACWGKVYVWMVTLLPSEWWKEYWPTVVVQGSGFWSSSEWVETNLGLDHIGCTSAYFDRYNPSWFNAYPCFSSDIHCITKGERAGWKDEYGYCEEACTFWLSCIYTGCIRKVGPVASSSLSRASLATAASCMGGRVLLNESRVTFWLSQGLLTGWATDYFFPGPRVSCLAWDDGYCWSQSRASPK